MKEIFRKLFRKIFKKRKVLVYSVPKKIHQGNEIYAACKKIGATFTANDVKAMLMQSDSEKMRNLRAGCISAQLCKLAQDQKILLVRKGEGIGRPNYFKFNKGK